MSMIISSNGNGKKGPILPTKKVNSVLRTSVLGRALEAIADSVKAKEAMAKKRAEEEESRRKEIAHAIEVVEYLVPPVAEIEHFLLVGEPNDVALAMDQEFLVESRRESQDLCEAHFTEGSVELDGENLKKGSLKLHCVIPARLEAFKQLAECAHPREAGPETRLRGLKAEEIVKIALDLKILEPLGNGFTIGKSASQQDHNEVTKTLAKIREINPPEVIEVKREPRDTRTLQERATHHSLEKVLKEGGTYLAFVPETEVKGELKKGGSVLLHFELDEHKDQGLVTIDHGPVFVEGGFFNYMQGMRNRNPVISMAEVKNICQGGSEPTKNLAKHNMSLWYIVERHAKWLESQKKEREAISRMRRETDLSPQDWANGGIGSAVLEMLNNEGLVAIRVERTCPEMNGPREPIITLREVSPSAMKDMRSFIGTPNMEVNPVGNLAKFLTAWRSEFERTKSA